MTGPALFKLPLPPLKMIDIQKVQAQADAAVKAAQAGATSMIGDPAVIQERIRNTPIFQGGAAGLTDANQGTGLKDPNAFDVLRYPTKNLGMDEYPHYVMFFIIERNSSIKDAEKSSSFTTKNFDYSSKNQGVDPTATAVLMTGAGVVGGGAVGAAVAQVEGGIFGLTAGSDIQKTVSSFDSIGGAIVGGVAGATMGDQLQQDRTRVLLKTAIALYLPNKPVSAYNAEWMSEDLGIMGALAHSAKNIDLRHPSTILQAIKDSSKGLAQSVIMMGATKINPGGFGNVGSTLQVAAAQVPNPFKAQLFKAMGFRQFAFDYSFLPENPKELAEVQKIILTFKRYMHPTMGRGTNKYILSYPAEFELGFYHKGKVNENLFKVSNCALTNMVVDYGGTDFTTFRSSPGAPTEITMKLSFTELEMLTRERVEAGY